MKALRNWSASVVLVTALGVILAGCEGDSKKYYGAGAGGGSPTPSLILSQPTANPTPVVAGSGDKVTLTIVVDASNPVTVDWKQRGGQVVQLVTSSNANVFIGVLDEPGVAGDLIFQAVVSGSNGTTQTSNDVVVTVTGAAANQPPVFGVQPFANPDNAVAGSSTLVTMECVVIDGDNDPLQLIWAQTFGIPVSLTTTTVAGGIFRATFTVPSTAGNLTFEVGVDDGQGNQVGSLPVTVQATSASGGNNPPVFTSTLTAAPTTVLEGAGGTVTVETRAIDPDGDTLTVNWIQVAGSPQSLSLTHVADRIVATLTDPLVAGTYSWVVEISDGTAPPVQSNQVDLIVTATPPPGDRAPVITQQLTSTLATVVAGSAVQVTLQASANDPDNDPVTVTLRQSAGVGVNLAITTLGDQVTATFTAPASADTLTFEVDFSSTTFVTTTNPVSVTVTPSVSNNAPVITTDLSRSPVAVQVSSGNIVILQATAIEPDGDAMTEVWTQVSGPTATMSTWVVNDTYYMSFPAPSTTGTAIFEVSFTDTVLTTTSSQVSVDVTVNPPTNQPPAITVQPAATPVSVQAGTGAQVSVSLTVVDPELDTVLLSWAQASGPTVTLSASSVGNVYTVVFTAPATSGVPVVLQATATDSINTPVVSNMVSIDVTAASPTEQPTDITLVPSSVNLVVGGSTANFNANLTTDLPQTRPGVEGVEIFYTSSDTGIATIDNNTGVVTPVAVGTCDVLVSATLNGTTINQTKSNVITVAASGGGGGGGGTPTLASIAITTTGPTVDVGVALPASAVRTHNDSSTDTITTSMLWGFDPPSDGVVDRNGVVTMARPNVTGKVTAYDIGGTPSGLNVTRTYLEVIGSNELSITSTTVAPVSSQLGLLTDTGVAFVGATGRLYIPVMELSTDTNVTTQVTAGGTITSSDPTKAAVGIDASGLLYLTGQNAGEWTLTVSWNGMTVTLDGRTIIRNPMMLSDPFHTLKGVVDPIAGMTRPYFENGVWNYSLLFSLDPSIVASMANPGFWGNNAAAPVAMANTYLDENGTAWAAHPDTYTGGSGTREPPGFLYLGNFDGGPSTGWTFPDETSVQGSLLYDGIIGDYKMRFRMHKSTFRDDIWCQPVYRVSLP